MRRAGGPRGRAADAHRVRSAAGGRGGSLNLAGLGFALAAALGWGIGDFSGGFLSRRAGVLLVGLAMETIGIAVALALALLSGDPFPSPAAVAWSLAAGIVGIAGLLVFYRALAGGAMSLVAPVAAVVGAGLPVIAGYAFGERMGGGQAAGILVALVAVVLVSRPADGAGGDSRWAWLALVAGLCFAAYFVGVDRAVAAGAGTWWPVPIARAGSIVVTGVGVLVTSQGRGLR
ncbi:MAG TPA: EamA family transporter, partial [Candidatus Acidoferrales bacterium]|nr:EamA family transporter [Candidatus Acidoferrales bacterium]